MQYLAEMQSLSEWQVPRSDCDDCDPPQAAAQRMVWRLRDNGKLWTRKTWTLEQGGSRETFLVFRKRAAK